MQNSFLYLLGFLMHLTLHASEINYRDELLFQIPEPIKYVFKTFLAVAKQDLKLVTKEAYNAKLQTSITYALDPTWQGIMPYEKDYQAIEAHNLSFEINDYYYTKTWAWREQISIWRDGEEFISACRDVGSSNQFIDDLKNIFINKKHAIEFGVLQKREKLGLAVELPFLLEQCIFLTIFPTALSQMLGAFEHITTNASYEVQTDETTADVVFRLIHQLKHHSLSFAFDYVAWFIKKYKLVSEEV